ncbi:hypothetical protein WI0192307A02_CDS0021 [Pseudomonas phage KG853]
MEVCCSNGLFNSEAVHHWTEHRWWTGAGTVESSRLLPPCPPGVGT